LPNFAIILFISPLRFLSADFRFLLNRLFSFFYFVAFPPHIIFFIIIESVIDILRHCFAPEPALAFKTSFFMTVFFIGHAQNIDTSSLGFAFRFHFSFSILLLLFSCID